MGHLDMRVIDWRGERARAGSFKGDDKVAFLNPVVGGRALSVDFVHRCLNQLAAKGFQEVVTSALSPLEQIGFLGAGFEVKEQLCVLSFDLASRPRKYLSSRSGATALRRGGPADIQRVLEVDALAFRPFWRIDQVGLQEARRATPRSRFRIGVLNRDERPAGYAITGKAGRHGFLQRLAVRPDDQRKGTGTDLVIDGLRWLNRWRVRTVLVNTQYDNGPALGLYASLGFRRELQGLSVLAADIEA